MFKKLFNKKNIFLIILIILISLHVLNFLGFISLFKKNNKEEKKEEEEEVDPFTLTFPSTTLPLGPLGSIPIKLGSITFNARASASGAMPASIKADAGF